MSGGQQEEKFQRKWTQISNFYKMNLFNITVSHYVARMHLNFAVKSNYI